MIDEDNLSKEHKDIDLSLENHCLETEIILKGGMFGKAEDLDPDIENQFLKNILAFEQLKDEPEISMRSIFPADYVFPSIDIMSEKDISGKLGDIGNILSNHNVELGFSDELPDRVLYRYLVEECIPKKSIEAMAGGFTWVLDGCTGSFEDRFQKMYCKAGQESI
jgi:hypothetical protein